MYSFFKWSGKHEWLLWARVGSCTSWPSHGKKSAKMSSTILFAIKVPYFPQHGHLLWRVRCSMCNRVKLNRVGEGACESTLGFALKACEKIYSNLSLEDKCAIVGRAMILH